nr:mannitol dehydrogenase family protein [Kineosporia babensis]
MTRSAPADPVRIVHLGLGAFHRAHQAWATMQAGDGWGIAAYTWRRPDAAQLLSAQDGLFTLLERQPDGDVTSTVTSVSRAVDGSDVADLLATLSRSEVGVVTLTITEAGYQSDATDVLRLKALLGQTNAAGGEAPVTALGRLVLALEARRRAGAGPLALVPCDNLPGNGDLLRRILTELAGEHAPGLLEQVSFVSTTVDRITPATTPEDVARTLALSGIKDPATVVTEPFFDWVLQGEFPGGRPAWEKAGARVVGDVEPFERRKLWLLNGSHSYLAYAGPARGHRTVAEAIADPVLLAGVEALWDEAARHLPDGLDLTAYRQALLGRFRNARIQHQLNQIGRDGTQKLRLRTVPVLLAERAAGRDGHAAAAVVAAWVAAARAGTLPPDALQTGLADLTNAELPVLLGLIDERLADENDLTTLIKNL